MQYVSLDRLLVTKGTSDSLQEQIVVPGSRDTPTTEFRGSWLLERRLQNKEKRNHSGRAIGELALKVQGVRFNGVNTSTLFTSQAVRRSILLRARVPRTGSQMDA